MNHDRTRAHVHDARKSVTTALADLSLERDRIDLDTAAEQAADQVWDALAVAHKHLTTALAAINADANRQEANRG